MSDQLRSTSMAKSAQNSRESLLRLSAELLSQIVGLCERSDFKSLRLMNSRLRDVASARMFESICVGLEPSTLRQLQNISKSPFWAAQVRHLKWITPSGNRSTGIYSDQNLEVVSNCLQQLPSVKTISFSEFGLHFVPGYLYFHRRLAETLWFIRLSTLQIDNVIMIFKYDSNTNVEETDISCSDHGSSASNLPELPQLSLFMLQNERCTITKLSITRMMVDVSDFWIFENVNALRLTDLKLSEVILAPSELALSEENDPLLQLLSVLRHQALLSSDPPMRVTLIEIGKHGHTGMMSATNEEISAWIDGDGDLWLAENQALFTQCPQELSEENEGY